MYKLSIKSRITTKALKYKYIYLISMSKNIQTYKNVYTQTHTQYIQNVMYMLH